MRLDETGDDPDICLEDVTINEGGQAVASGAALFEASGFSGS